MSISVTLSLVTDASRRGQHVVHAAVNSEPDAALCEAAHRLSAGNPFLLHELLRALPADGPRTAAEIERARPQSVARGISRRMAGLSNDAGALGDAVAILGDGSELRHGAALAGLDEREAIAAADELTAAGVLSAGRPLRFEHPLVRSALHDAQPLQARDRAHLDAARLLAAEGAAADRIALTPGCGADSGTECRSWRIHSVAEVDSQSVRKDPMVLTALSRALRRGR
jgi:predicted ATPase